MRRLVFILLIFCVIFVAFQISVLGYARWQINKIPAGQVIGPANADLNVVEFLDYSCAHCKSIDPIIMDSIQKDGYARYIPRPITSGSTESSAYAQTAYAAGMQGKFLEMHHALLNFNGTFNEAARDDLAKKIGIDPAKLAADVKSKDVKNVMDNNINLVRVYYSDALPIFVIGGKILYAPREITPTADDFIRLFAEARGRK